MTNEVHEDDMEPWDAIRRNVKDSMQSQVENFILGKIESGEWPADSKIPSERELTVRLEVSRTTVRNAVQSLTERGLFDRRIGQGTFVRAPLSEASATKEKTGTLGYVVCKERAARKPISTESFYFDVFAGIEEETVRSGRHLLFSYLDDSSDEEIASFEAFLAKVDGIVLEEATNGALLDSLARRAVPTVLLAPSASHEKLDIIAVDLGAGVRKALAHLRSGGHERIGLIGGPARSESARIRTAAWKEEMRSWGTAAEDCSEEAADWSAEAGFAAMQNLARRCPGLDAVFCANDLLAVGALSALGSLGLRVPDDLSLIGFDDTELSRHTQPALTTMKIYSRDMARSAVKRLVERIESGDMPPVRVEYPIDLVIRSSCKEVSGQIIE